MVKGGPDLVSRQFLEDLHSFVEVVYDFLLWIIIRIAVCFQSADTCAMLVPFMLPEIFVVASEIFPKITHKV
jgi:hypothetical protein